MKDCHLTLILGNLFLKLEERKKTNSNVATRAVMVLLHFGVGVSLDVILKRALGDPDDYCLLSKVNLPQGKAPRCPHGWLRTSLVHLDTPIMIGWT